MPDSLPQPDALTRICADTAADVEKRRHDTPLAALKHRIAKTATVRAALGKP